MWRKTVFLLSLVGVFYGCDMRKGERVRLQTKVDSLSAELETTHKAVSTLHDVAALMDSIDAHRNALRTSMVEGTSFDDYTSRMKEINQFVKQAQERIAFLENRVKSLKSSSSSYAGTIEKLKHDLNARNEELAAMQAQVDKYRNENDNLVQTVNLQKSEIADKLNQLQSKSGTIDTLERRVNDMIAESKIDEAEAYYLRAQAVEETANRTRFAPKKKRNTRKEALELYKLAASFGKGEAESKIRELEKEI